MTSVMTLSHIFEARLQGRYPRPTTSPASLENREFIIFAVYKNVLFYSMLADQSAPL